MIHLDLDTYGKIDLCAHIHRGLLLFLLDSKYL